MKRLPTLRSVSCLLAVLCATASPQVFAQAAPTAADTTATDNTVDEEPIELSPFMVQGRSDEGYQATQTLAGTRVRTDLRDVGSAITVVTKKFMQDIGATNNQTLLQYTTNTEVGGVYGNFGGVGNGPQIAESDRLLRPSENTRVRGLTNADNTRNFFVADIPWDGYNVDRVDMQRGANSILFGVGSPAGIINTNLNDARFKTAASYEIRFGKYGSVRNVLDLNYAVLPNELAFRVEGLDDNEKYQQKPAFNHDKRVYAALRFDPKWLSKGSAHTTFRANFERGIIHANRPRTLPPIDAITPWFLTGSHDLNHRVFDPFVTWAKGNEADNTGSTYIPWFNEAFMGRMFNADVGLFFNANSGAPTMIQQPTASARFGISTAGTIDAGIDGIPFARPLGIAGYNSYSRGAFANLPGSQYNVYKDKFLSDPSIFDFFNNLIDGNNKWEKQDWNALNLDLSQTFLDNRLAFDLAYFYQKYNEAQESFLNDQQYAISVDINSRLMDGSANPNVGRPYVANSGLYGNQGNNVERDSIRLTGMAEVRATDFLRKGGLADVLGRHTFTGLLSRDTVKTKNLAWARYAADLGWSDVLGGSRSISDGDRQVDWVTYIGPSLVSATSAANAHLSPVTVMQGPPDQVTVRYFDSHWGRPTNPTDPNYVNPADDWTNPFDNSASHQSENPTNYVGWVSRSFNILNADRGDIAQLYRDGSRRENQVESVGLTWQGHLLDDALVPTVGWRRDTVGLWSAAAPKDPITKVAAADFDLGPRRDKQSENSTSWSVVGRLPRRWQLPWGTNISAFYNEGRNFKADQIRKDIEGRTISNQIGKTKDYGIIISTLDDKVSLKINWYKTTVQNATLEGTGAGIGGNLYYLYLLEAWGTASAVIDARGLAGDPAAAGVPWYWDWANHDANTPYGAIPRDPAGAAVDAKEQAAIKSWIAQLPSQSFFDAYGLPVNVAKLQSGDLVGGLPGFDINNGVGSLQSATGGTINGIAPVATVDTISKGVEFELFAQPTRNWNIALNAAKTDASRVNLSSTLQHFIEYQKAMFDSPAGDLRLWWAGDNTLRKYWNDNIYGPYQFLLAQQGSSAPEIRPWRANLVTNYNFDTGMLRGVNVGLAYRWQQGEILGYALDSDGHLDVSKPYRGSSEDYVDLWIGYQHKLTNKVTWRIQLNTRNVGRSAHLVPISVEPDGSPAAFRIEEGMGWQVTNTFSF
jgi:hypothetical protein